MIRPGGEGESLPSGATVFRLFRATNDGKFPPEAFHLSSDDKAQPIPRLSVWERTNTSLAQADVLTGGKNALAGFLPVDRVRELRPEPDHVDVKNLDVQWEKALVSEPGHEGHCGIVGLSQERTSDGMSLKNHRKSLYAKLARLANATSVETIRRDQH